MADPGLRIQDRADADRAFWRENYRPCTLATVQEICSTPRYVPRYSQEISITSSTVRTQLAISADYVKKEQACASVQCCELADETIAEMQARGFAIQSVIRAEETRAESRNADRLLRRLEMIKVGRGFEANGQALMAASARESEVIAKQAETVFALAAQAAGQIASRALSSVRTEAPEIRVQSVETVTSFGRDKTIEATAIPVDTPVSAPTYALPDQVRPQPRRRPADVADAEVAQDAIDLGQFF
jgi:hypothetical protein